VFRQHGVDEAHPQRLVGPQTSRCKEDLSGRCLSDDADQGFEAPDVISQAELRGGDGEHTVLRAVTQVGGQGDCATPSDTESVDQGDQRLLHFCERGECARVAKIVLGS